MFRQKLLLTASTDANSPLHHRIEDQPICCSIDSIELTKEMYDVFWSCESVGFHHK